MSENEEITYRVGVWTAQPFKFGLIAFLQLVSQEDKLNPNIADACIRLDPMLADPAYSETG
jgi:hypothetical protein